MTQRSQPGLVQVCLALVCALAAAFSGIHQARYLGSGQHQSRQSRAAHPRARAAGRGIPSDYALEAELSQDPDGQVHPSDQGSLPAERIEAVPSWTAFGLVLAPPVPSAPSFERRAPPSRGPPSRA